MYVRNNEVGDTVVAEPVLLPLTGVDTRQVAAARPLWVPTLQLLVVTLRASADRRRRGLVGNLLTEEELSRIEGCARASALGSHVPSLTAVALKDGQAHLPEWQALLYVARQL